MDKIMINRKAGVMAFIIAALVMVLGSSLMAERNIVAVARFTPAEMKDGAPLGWELQTSKGTPDLELVKEGEHYVLHLKSDSRSSFGIKKEMELEEREYPYLNWKWKVCKLPTGGDVRNADTDDQALQLYVFFRQTKWPAKLNTPSIGYIWGNECPKETPVTSPQPMAGKVRYLAIRNKTDSLGKWYTEKRNIYEDYKKLFPDIDGGSPRDVIGVSIYINSQHTKSEAESYISNVYFSRN